MVSRLIEASVVMSRSLDVRSRWGWGLGAEGAPPEDEFLRRRAVGQRRLGVHVLRMEERVRECRELAGRAGRVGAGEQRLPRAPGGLDLLHVVVADPADLGQQVRRRLLADDL